MTSDLLDIEEAAGFLHVKTCTIRSWVLKKKIAHVKLGRRVFLRRCDLEALVEESLVPAKGKVRA